MNHSVFLVLCLLIFSNIAVSSSVLTVGYTHIPPYSFNPSLRPQPKHKGLLLDAYETVFKKMGISFQLEYLPPKRLYRQLSTGRIDMAMVGEKNNLDSGADIICTLYSESALMTIYSTKEKPFPQSAKNSATPHTVMISTSLNSERIKHLLPDDINIGSVRPELLFDLLKTGRADWIIDLQKRTDSYLTDINNTAYTATTLSSANYHLCIHRQYPEAEEKAQQITNILRQLQNSPESQGLYHRY